MLSSIHTCLVVVHIVEDDNVRMYVQYVQYVCYEHVCVYDVLYADLTQLDWISHSQ